APALSATGTFPSCVRSDWDDVVEHNRSGEGLAAVIGGAEEHAVRRRSQRRVHFPHQGQKRTCQGQRVSLFALRLNSERCALKYAPVAYSAVRQLKMILCHCMAK